MKKKKSKAIARKAHKKPGTAVAIHKPPPPPKTALEVIRDAAVNPKVDVAKWNALLSFQERLEAREAEKAFNIALQEAQRRMPKVLKDRANTHTQSRYSTLEKVHDTIWPIARELGFSLSFGTEQSHLPDHYRVIGELTNAGHSRIYKVDVPADIGGPKGNANKSATQAFGSTMTYARRYLTLLIFNIVLTDKDNQDTDGNPPAPIITPEQAQELNSLLDDAGADKRAFCNLYGIDGVPLLLAKDYADATRKVKTKIARQKEKAATP